MKTYKSWWKDYRPKPEKERIIELFQAICAHARGTLDEVPNDENGVNSANMRLIIYCDALFRYMNETLFCLIMEPLLRN